MATLLLQCVGPLQSWGTQSQFSVRDTGRAPSKSGIIGLLCAAKGVPRHDTSTIAQLAALKMAVRVDREGKILRDYHTAGMGGYVNASGKTVRGSLITSDRYYLTDAAFLVALEGDKALLADLHTALKAPYWMLCLGRKACPPSLPVYLPDGLRDEGWWELFQEYPWLGRIRRQYDHLDDKVRIVFDDDNGPQVRQDHPISFEKGKRKFAPRRVNVDFMPKPPFKPEFAAVETPTSQVLETGEVSDEQEES
ncbi:MAG: type I-E CRISPR-associated protein Cas5/CasD [Anaerolineae bacterium]|nr:type I-E CRISPR-associated protein Cas5/CasD [Anaerolineae bacterium]